MGHQIKGNIQLPNQRCEEVGGKEYAYSVNQAEGALLNGSFVRKIKGEEGDDHVEGTRGVVIGSITTGDSEVPYGYFIRFDGVNDFPRFIAGSRVEAVE
jgi:hypothetical protein